MTIDYHSSSEMRRDMTAFLPFWFFDPNDLYASEKPHVLTYLNESGTLWLLRVQTNGVHASVYDPEANWAQVIGKGFGLLEPTLLNGRTGVMAYNSDSGLVRVTTIPTDSMNELSFVEFPIGVGFSQVVLVAQSKYPYAAHLYYDPRTGNAELHGIRTNVPGVERAEHVVISGLPSDCTALAPLHYTAGEWPTIMAVSASCARFFTFSESGEDGWTFLDDGQCQAELGPQVLKTGGQEVLGYDPLSGRVRLAKVIRTDPSVYRVEIQSETRWHRDCELRSFGPLIARFSRKTGYLDISRLH